MSEPLSAAESSVDVLNSESSHTLDYNSEGRDISIFIMVLYKIQGIQVCTFVFCVSLLAC